MMFMKIIIRNLCLNNISYIPKVFDKDVSNNIYVTGMKALTCHNETYSSNINIW